MSDVIDPTDVIASVMDSYDSDYEIESDGDTYEITIEDNAITGDVWGDLSDGIDLRKVNDLRSIVPSDDEKRSYIVLEFSGELTEEFVTVETKEQTYEETRQRFEELAEQDAKSETDE